MRQDAATCSDLFLERGEFGVGQSLSAELGRQVYSVEAEFAASFPDGFEHRPGVAGFRVQAEAGFVLGELAAQILPKIGDEFVQSRVVVVGRGEREGHDSPGQLTWRAAPAQ